MACEDCSYRSVKNRKTNREKEKDIFIELWTSLRYAGG